MLQKEITSPQSLLDNEGHLAVRGWSREPILTYDRSEIKKALLRSREWDHYVIQNSQYALSLYIADYGYFGFASAALLDFRGEYRRYIKTKWKLLTLGQLGLPGSTLAGDTNFDTKKLGMKFSRSSNNRYLKSEFMNFYDGKVLTVSIALDNPDDNMVSAVASFPGSPDHFAYCQKVIGMPAGGFVKFGGEEFTFEPSNSHAFLSWGRGVLPSENRWYWCAAQGDVRGKALGFNFGGGLGDNSEGSENAVFYDGKLYKLSGLSVQKPRQEGQAWKFFTKDRRIQLQFAPEQECGESKHFLHVTHEQKLQFGTYTGRMVLDGGDELRISGMNGFCHWTHNKL